MEEASDRLVSVVTIVLNTADAHHMDDVVTVLEHAGLSMDRLDRDNGVIEATGPTEVVVDLDKHHLFETIRTTFSYWSHVPRDDEREAA